MDTDLRRRGRSILPKEIKELHEYGIARIFSPEDGRRLGLQGMINVMLEECDFPTVTPDADAYIKKLGEGDTISLAKLITLAEYHSDTAREAAAAVEPILEKIKGMEKKVPVLGITGTGGAGKSSLTDELVRRFLNEIPGKRVAVLSIDPTKQKTGGALLGDRIRMNSINSPRVYMRSLATRKSKSELSLAIQDAISITKAAGFDLIIVETSGIGQGDAEIAEIADISLYVMTSEFGAPTQLENRYDRLCRFRCCQQFERKGSEDAKRLVQNNISAATIFSTKIWMRCRSTARLPVSSTMWGQTPSLRRSLTNSMKRRA